MSSLLEIKNVLVVGAGAWGGAIAQLIAENMPLEELDYNLLLYGNEDFDILSKHPKLGIKLNKNIVYSKSFSDVTDFLKIVDCIFLVIPSNALVTLSNQIKQVFDSQLEKRNVTMPIVICTKGLDGKNDCLYSDSLGTIFKDIKSTSYNYQIGVLSGPNFATQVAKGLPAVTNIAFEDIEIAKKVAQMCMSQNFAVKCINDLRGAQVLGAYKNVMALVMGLLEGLEYTSNTIAKYLCNCIPELIQLIEIFKGDKNTILEPCGIGDIYLTCTNKESRNTSFGFKLGKYSTFKEFRESNYISTTDEDALNKTVEGVNAVKSIKQISDKHNLNISSIETLYGILFEDKLIKESIENLVSS